MKKKFIASIMALAISASAAGILPSASANAGWVSQNNSWYYYDENGNMKTNTWFYDSDYDSWYYVDKNGKEAFGPELFTTEGVDTVVKDKKIIQTKNINGINFKFTIGLDNWEQKTSPEQIITISDLFWNCYPKMYARFSDGMNCPTEILFTIDQIADPKVVALAYSTARISLKDSHLQNNPTDYDCITHELGHQIQNTWDTSYVDIDVRERFADYCRYVYAYKNGYYNDKNWTLQTSTVENNRKVSNRFFVWLDYRFSSSNKDIIHEFIKTWFNKDYLAKDWDKAWAKIFAGTELEGMTINEVWNEYLKDNFAALNSHVSTFGQVSDLIRNYNVRYWLAR